MATSPSKHQLQQPRLSTPKSTHGIKSSPNDISNNAATNNAQTNATKKFSDDCLEASLSILHQSMEQARAMDCLEREEEEAAAADEKKQEESDQQHQQQQRDPTETNARGGGGGGASSNTTTNSVSWWMQLIQRMEADHEHERQTWKRDYNTVQRRKSDYKSELRDTYTQRLLWLEGQLRSIVSPAPTPPPPEGEGPDDDLVPAVSRASTSTTHASLSLNSQFTASTPPPHNKQNGQPGIQPPSLAMPESDSSKNITLDESLSNHSSSHVQRRLRQLEDALEWTIQQHDNERAAWMQTVEQTQRAQATGEKLTRQQEEQLLQLQHQISQQQQNQRQQWKEKIKVLESLLELMEQQQETERTEWKSEVQDYQEALQKMEAQLVVSGELADNLRAEQRSAQAEWDLKKAALERTIAELTADKADLRKQVDKWYEEARTLRVTQASTTTSFERRRAGSNGDLTTRVPSSPGRRIEWDDKLDRAVAERDLYQQEAERAAELIEKERNEWRAQLHDALQQEREQWKQQLQNKSIEVDQIKAAMDQERQKWMEQLEQRQEEWNKETEHRLEELRQIYAEEEYPKSDSELMVRYRDSVDKRNDLVHRMRRMEHQRSVDKGAWKLQLEAALAEARRAEETIARLEGQLQEQRSTREKEKDEWMSRVQSEKAEAEARLELLKAELNDKFNEMKEGHAEGKRIWEERLASALEEAKRQEAKTKENHAKETKKLKQELEKQLRTKSAEVTRLRNEQERKEKILLGQAGAKSKRELEELTDLKEKYARQSEEWQKQLQDAQAEIAQVRQDQKDQSQDLANAAVRYAEELAELKEKYAREAVEWQEQLKGARQEINQLREGRNEQSQATNALKRATDDFADLKNRHAREKDEWQKQLKESQNEITRLRKEQKKEQGVNSALASKRATEELVELKKKHNRETEEWQKKLKESQDEMRKWEDKANSLAKRTAELQQEIERTKVKRGKNQDGRVSHNDRGTAQSGPEADREAICKAIEELRLDMIAIRETIDHSTMTDELLQNSNFADYRDDLDLIQGSLTDIVGELTLETEALYDVRSGVRQMIDEASGLFNKYESTPRRFNELQEKLLSELSQIQDGIKHIDDGSAMRNSVQLEVIKELQLKSSELATCLMELELVKERLTEEIAKREKAETEVATLNDQADAYTEEIMRLQSTTDRLEQTLKEAEQKLALALYGRRMTTVASVHSDACPTSPGEEIGGDTDNSSPLLEEALALAQGLTDVVRGKGDGTDTNVMEMLESLSELMDQHDRGLLLRQTGNEMPLESHAVGCSGSPQSRSDTPPRPVDTPQLQDREVSTLQLVVEELYGRCQLLERERLDMMEVTLDLLESAREASAAELEAALATARRKASDEMLRLRDKSRQDQERLYHKLCNRCMVGLLTTGRAD